MNKKRLREAEQSFLTKYPGGFEDPQLAEIGKRHRMDQMVEMASSAFGRRAFDHPGAIIEDMIRVVARSSMVSMFEKPKYRDYLRSLTGAEQGLLANSLKRQLYGKGSGRVKGFKILVDILRDGKMARWSLVTIIPNYVLPDDEVFLKPTTVKGVIKQFELDLDYKPQPSWEFYSDYRERILEMKAEVDPAISPSNAAFCGFLMMSLPGK